jgi:hypothetical protein
MNQRVLSDLRCELINGKASQELTSDKKQAAGKTGYPVARHTGVSNS